MLQGRKLPYYIKLLQSQNKFSALMFPLSQYV